MLSREYGGRKLFKAKANQCILGLGTTSFPLTLHTGVPGNAMSSHCGQQPLRTLLLCEPLHPESQKKTNKKTE